ncbi:MULTISPECIES: hypothetical protein [Photobacterium]|uniref:Uncharacterized protein n=1 Tax=Photobacterium piscicola TaxID=1378299 RepID=A0A1T5HYJ1_9GAMM|nr:MULTISPECIES: hypothetical protein [Photobacterium]MEC6795619.1 hypothetical protein [Photobacterium sp. S4TG1]MEC6822265.1 hypothetical protein [Photobacterium piscicola]MEC6881157.1 hypothetical protein [Photobacterium piscicola]MEC6897328.1 hypothetical protein [Photobacterium piscicola]MEC6906504.1 hypothetical protein [Photobacterium piscicola]
MTMISAKEFSGWLLERFADETQGVSLSREDINMLTGRQSFSLGYIHDIHYEVMRHGMAFVTDTTREMFYLVPISERPWRKQLEKHYEHDLYCNVLPLNKSG